MGLVIARLNTLPTDVTNISVGSRIILPNGKEYILNNLKVWIPIHMMALEVKEDLLNEDLNTIDKFGIYHQNSNNNALISKNYPVQSAGVLKVYVNNGNVFQEYQILTGQYNENQIYTRGKYAGYWSNWLKPNYVNINESDYNSLLSNKHTHNNKSLLDSYTQTNENLLDAVNKKHLHSNINELNSINSTKINNWDIAYSWGNHNSFNYLTQTSGDIRYLKNTGYNYYDGSIHIINTENEDTSYFESGISNAFITNNTINLSGFGLYSKLKNNLINNYWFGITEYAPMVPPNEIKFFEYDKTINRWTIGKNVPIYLNTLNLGTVNQNKILTLDTSGKLGYIDGIPVLKSDLLNNNIGIGTASPIAKLDVNGDILLRTGIISGESNIYTTNPLSHAIKIGIPGRDYMDFYEYGGIFNFYQNTSTPSLLMTIKPTGVGIGTTSPSEKLEVAGYVKAIGFKTPSGTSTQILMANGSVIEKSTIANQTLSTSIDNNGRYLSISGGNQVSIDGRLLHVVDSPNRNPNDAIFYPNATGKSVRFDFISAGHVTGTGNYAGLMTFSPWDGTTNSTGDSSYQLVFYNQTGINGSGIPGLKIRKGIDTTWNSWYKIYTDGDFSQSNINNWNTAYGWGNHASAGYALANGTNATNNWSNTSSGLALNPALSGKTLNASGQNVYLRDATYGQISGIVQDDTNGPIINDWTNRLKTLHNNSAGYFTELAQSFTGVEGVWHRRNVAGTISSWKRLYDDSIWNAASLSYSGSTLTLTINGIPKTATINAGTNYTAGTNISISSNQISVLASPTFSGNVTASGFYESSLRELKENILPFELSGLGLLSQLEIVTYDRIDKSSLNKIGIIADDSPEEFLSEEKDAVDLYKTVFIQAKAIQELKSEVDELKEELNNLRDLIMLNLNQF